MNVCTAANSKYVRYLYVMLFSLYQNNKGIDLYILENDFTDEDKSLIEQLSLRYGNTVTFIHLNREDFNVLPTTYRYSIETYFRFKMIECLPENLDRILYLDVDLIIQGSVKELYDTDLGDNYFAACNCMMQPKLVPSKQKLFNRYDDLRYFNAGVMIWNLRRLRGNVCFEDFIRGGEKLNFDLPSVDQEILNYLYFDKTLYLNPYRYNYLVYRELSMEKKEKESINYDNVIIYHFCWYNPWQVGPKSETHKIWWKYAKQTPFYIEFLEEQLERCEDYIYRQGDTGSGVEKQRAIRTHLELLYNLKGNDALKKYFSDSDEKVFFYGAGYMAEILFELFTHEGVADRLVGVIDMRKTGSFHGYKLTNSLLDVEKENCATIIVTPIEDRAKILNEVESKVNHAKVVEMYDFLRRLEERGI
ncbi:MAG: glycosyltransferase family 8 protein [Lachnospiraceae bacterium]|nr:glycosyltransferase family 8 protein [Lachnospiraceae bacterium]